MRRHTLAALALTTLALIACDANVLQPEAAYDPMAQMAQTGSPAVHAVTGGGGVDLTDIFGTPFKLRSEARVAAFLDAEGTASGSFGTALRRPPGLDPTPASGNADFQLGATVDCLEVDGNTAWISGVTTRAKSDLPFPNGPEVGRTVIMMVRDLGPADDRAVIIAADFLGVDSCRDRPDPEPFFVDPGRGGGNFVIR